MQKPVKTFRGQLAFDQEGPWGRGEGRWVHLRQAAEIWGKYMSSGGASGRDMAAVNEGHAGVPGSAAAWPGDQLKQL